MSEKEGVYISRPSSLGIPYKQGSIFDSIAVVSGTTMGRDIWLVRKKEQIFSITRHNDLGDRKPPQRNEFGKHELIYPEIKHHEKIDATKPKLMQLIEIAEKIINTIKMPDKNKKGNNTSSGKNSEELK